MSVIATGTYQNGQIKLDSLPPGIERARVRVEFEDAEAAKGAGEGNTGVERKKFALQFGMLAVPGAALSTWEDFANVKNQWQPKDA